MRTFVEKYFENKPLEKLKRTITPAWTDQNRDAHLKMIDVPPDAKRILEIGCGTGRLLSEIAKRLPHALCTGLDASNSMIRHAESRCNIQYHLANPFDPACGWRPDGRFDFIFCWLVCQHVPSTEGGALMLKRTCNWLERGGIARVQMLSHDIKPGHELWTYHDESLLTVPRASCAISRKAIGDTWQMLEIQRIKS